MLNVWEGAQRYPKEHQQHPRAHSNSQDNHPTGSGISVSASSSISAALPMDPSSEASSSIVSVKRARQSNSPDNGTCSVRPSKRVKGILSLEPPSGLPPGFHSANQLLGFAEIRNTIVICSPSDDVIDLISKFLTWTTRTVLAHPSPDYPCRQVSIVIVLNDAHVDELAMKISIKSRLKVAACHSPIDPTRWSEIIQNQVVVCLVDTILGLITRGVCTMSQILALIITEAPLALREGLPLTDVLEWFCRSPSVFVRPRILAFSPPMTSVDTGTMERLIDAKAVLSAPQRLRPSELVVQYEPSRMPTETRLTQNICQLGSHQVLRQSLFKDAQYVLQELGPCASDLVWRRAVNDLVINCKHDDNDPKVKAANNIRRFIENWVFSMPNANPSSRGFNITPKFARLVQVLRAYEPCGDKFRCIIYVSHSSVAIVMADMLRMMTDGLDFLRPLPITSNLAVIDMHHQMDIVRNFLTGKFNLLVLTRKLEDLEIPPSLLVVRYDPFESQLSFSYACARASLPSSCLVHMVENGNDVHRRTLSQFSEGTFNQEWIPVALHNGGVPIPSSSMLAPTQVPQQICDEDDTDSKPCLEDAVTGMRLYEEDALEVLYRLVANAQGPNLSREPMLVTEEIPSATPRKWVGIVTLPACLPIGVVAGPARSTPTHARRSAAFEACAQLFERGALDHKLFPVSQNAIPDAGGSVVLGTDKDSGNRCYPRKRSTFWLNSICLGDRRLFPFVVYVAGRGEDYAPLLILTRQPLPRIPSFRLFLPGTSETIQNLRGPPLVLNEQQLEAVHLFTLRVCRAISNKSLVCPVEQMAYMFAPLKLPDQGDTQSLDLLRLMDYIPWHTVYLAGKTWMEKFDLEELRTSPESVRDSVIQDRLVEFTRRYFVARLRQDLTPLSKPADSPREAKYANLVEYCKARRKNFEGLSDYSQPLVELAGTTMTGNHLNPRTRATATEPVKAAVKYLIPELCAKFTIPASTFRTALLLPSITKRIEDFLLVHELNANFFGHAIHENLLLSAISAPSAGFEVDYERLELLGDSFLKYLASSYVFVTNPAQHEGALHAARQRIISNKVLMQSADRIGLPQYIQSKPFSHKLWNPPNFSVDPLPPSNNNDHIASGDEANAATGALQAQQPSGSQDEDSAASNMPKKRKTRDENAAQWLGDKTIADVAEAIIGAAYLSGGQENALQAAKALQVPVPLIQQWQDFRRKAIRIPLTFTKPLRQGTTTAVEGIIGHRFRVPDLLAQALTHASIEGYDAICYERLEFLGDAILDFLAVRYIFSRDDNLSPGAMTLLKGAMVSNTALAAVCVSCGLHEHLHYDSYALATTFESYATRLEAKRQEAKGATAEEDRLGQYWLDVEPPKTLSDIVESILGALYVSDGFTLDGAEKFFDKVLKPFYDRHITLKTLSHHPTKILFELLQSHGCQQFELVKERCETTQETRCDCVVHQVTLASTVAATAQAAGRTTSMIALDALQGDPEFLSRICDCQESRMTHKGR